MPKGYFGDMGDYAVFDSGGYDVITLGTPYQGLREAIESLRSEGLDIRGFGDMSVEEITDLTGLGQEEATLAKERDFDEAFVFNGDTLRLSVAVRERGLNLTQGRLFHLTGDNDKGKAVDILKELYIHEYGSAVFMALGDSPTDIPMLHSVDYPVVVQKDDGTYDERVTAPNLIRAVGIGPEGWNRAVIELLRRLRD